MVPNAASPALRDAVPVNVRRALALSFPTRWGDRRAYRLPEHSGPLGRYYMTWRSDTSAWGEDWAISPFDSDGVLLTLGGKFYHPSRIAQFALHAHADWSERRSERALRAFRAQAQWLRDHQRAHRGIEGCYPFDFPWPRYGAACGWISAMAQGEAISVLLRADQMFPKDGYFDAAMRAATPFRMDLRDGGVVSRTTQGDVFFEEVAVEPPAHILNGHIYALWGLWELQRLTQESWLSDLVRDGAQTLCRRLPLYDSGYWSFYHLLAYQGGFRPVATLKYHAFHVAQLRVLAAMCGEQRFEAVANRWEAYQDTLLSRAKTMQNAIAALTLRALGRDVAAKSSNVVA
ncbi:MAG: hypothetical protein JOZ97_08010 [Candidatus Eremiobacteraeota bacterium]|nr:hypothetical protein [Candidatus Eremiobacteraeota bacterium]